MQRPELLLTVCATHAAFKCRSLALHPALNTEAICHWPQHIGSMHPGERSSTLGQHTCTYRAHVMPALQVTAGGAEDPSSGDRQDL